MTSDFDRPLPRMQRPEDAEPFLASILTQVEQINADLVKRQEREEQARAHEEDSFARAARKGELGRDWQVVQQRIDLHQTTLDDVFSGADTTPAARALREASQARFTQERAQWERETENGETNPLSEIEEMQAAAAERLEQIQRIVDGAMGR